MKTVSEAYSYHLDILGERLRIAARTLNGFELIRNGEVIGEFTAAQAAANSVRDLDFFDNGTLTIVDASDLNEWVKERPITHSRGVRK